MNSSPNNETPTKLFKIFLNALKNKYYINPYILLLRIANTLWYKMLSILLYAFLTALSLLATIALFYTFAEVAENGLPKLFANITPEYLEKTYQTPLMHYILILVFICIETILLKRFVHKKAKRGKTYILKLMSSENIKLPASSKAELIKRIAGDNAKSTAKTEIETLIENNVAPIKNFLETDSNSENTLVINSNWGAGKTTSLLIAINETDSRYNRYIYESVFKYNDSLAEFENDIMNALSDTLSKIGVYGANNRIRFLIQNLDSDPRKTLHDIIKTSPKQNYLTTELLFRINNEYERLHRKEKLYLIVDDLDRMQGKDILEVISLLSTLRRLAFVKIIILADLRIVIEALKTIGVVDAEKYIKKYLPDQSAIKVDSSYRMVTRILQRKITAKQKLELPSLAKPVLAAILIKLVADKLVTVSAGIEESKVIWLRNRSELQENIKGEARIILNAPRYVYSQSEEMQNEKYEWLPKTNPHKFEDIILGIKSASTKVSIANFFGEEEYHDLVETWIFGFVATHWDTLEFTFRDTLDILDSLNISGSSLNPGKIFTETFNQLFPKSPIKYFEEKN